MQAPIHVGKSDDPELNLQGKITCKVRRIRDSDPKLHDPDRLELQWFMQKPLEFYEVARYSCATSELFYLCCCDAIFQNVNDHRLIKEARHEAIEAGRRCDISTFNENPEFKYSLDAHEPILTVSFRRKQVLQMYRIFSFEQLMKTLEGYAKAGNVKPVNIFKARSTKPSKSEGKKSVSNKAGPSESLDVRKLMDQVQTVIGEMTQATPAVNDVVMIKELKSSAQFNGRLGCVIKEHNMDTDRCGVKIFNSDKEINVLVKNLMVIGYDSPYSGSILSQVKDEDAHAAILHWQLL